MLTFKLSSSIFSWNTKVDLLTSILNILTISFYSHSSIFMTWPPLWLNFIVFLSYNFSKFWKSSKYYNLKRFKRFSSICVLSFWQTRQFFKKTGICFNSNIFLSIVNVLMAISFKVFIVGISVFSKTCWKLNFTAM